MMNQPDQKKSPLLSARACILFMILIALSVYFCYSKISVSISKTPSLTSYKSAHELYRYAKTLNDKRQFSLSEKYLEKALVLDPKFYKAMLDLGWTYYEQGDFIKALPLFLQALDYAKNDKANYEICVYNLGSTYLLENKLEEAWNYLNQAYRMKSALGARQWSDDRSDPVYYVATADKNKFIECANKMYPNEMRYRIDRIRNFALFRKHKAIEDCEKYFIDNPNSRFTADILLNKAWVLWRFKEYDKVISILDLLKTANIKEDQKGWVAYALYSSYFSSRQYVKALDAIDSLYKNHPNLYDFGWFNSHHFFIEPFTMKRIDGIIAS